MSKNENNKEKKEKIETKLHQIRLPIKLLTLFEDLAISRGVTLNDYIKFAMLEKVEESKKNTEVNIGNYKEIMKVS